LSVEHALTRCSLLKKTSERGAMMFLAGKQTSSPRMNASKRAKKRLRRQLTRLGIYRRETSICCRETSTSRARSSLAAERTVRRRRAIGTMS
jgi:hypothetical protein